MRRTDETDGPPSRSIPFAAHSAPRTDDQRQCRLSDCHALSGTATLMNLLDQDKATAA
jgi:hypothetical protein